MTQAIVIHKMLNMRELTIPESRRTTLRDHSLTGNDYMDDSGKHHIFHDAGVWWLVWEEKGHRLHHMINPDQASWLIDEYEMKSKPMNISTNHSFRKMVK